LRLASIFKAIITATSVYPVRVNIFRGQTFSGLWQVLECLGSCHGRELGVRIPLWDMDIYEARCNNYMT
jgi:hypothetical protein